MNKLYFFFHTSLPILLLPNMREPVSEARDASWLLLLLAWQAATAQSLDCLSRRSLLFPQPRLSYGAEGVEG